MIKLLVTSLFTIFSILNFAQNVTFFLPTKLDSLFYENDLKTIEARFKTVKDNLPKEFRNEFKEIYTERFDAIKEHFTEKKLFANEQAKKYLNNIVKEIVSKNQLLNNLPLHVFFETTEVPNAAFIGENTVVFNTGLLSKLNNESELAFVLCHELAHFYLDHSNKKVEKYVTTVFSKEFQAELKSIKKSEYQTKARIEKLALGLTFNNRRHSRYKETEADSMGLVFMKNTNFDITESISLLKLLDGLDEEKVDMETLLLNNLNSTEYPFQKKWLQKEEGLFGGHADLKEDEKNKDSLKTHPDCKIRIEALQKMLTSNNQVGAKKFVVSQQLFTEFKTQFKLENINYYFAKKQFGFVLYYCLMHLEKSNNNPYLITTIGKVFHEIYWAQKNHELGKYVSLPSPDNDKSYNVILQFIQNLDIDDYVKIGENFLKKYATLYNKFPQFKTALNNLQKIKL